MKVKRLVGVLGVSIALAAPSLAVASTAGAAPGGSVARYELLTFTVTLNTGNVYVHKFKAVLNTGSGTFMGVGTNTSDNSKYETISGTYSNGYLTYVATQYNSSDPLSGAQVTWWTDSPVPIVDGTGTGAATGSAYFSNSPIAVSDLTVVPNHGTFVSMYPGMASAMSCIGMPVNAVSGDCTLS